MKSPRRDIVFTVESPPTDSDDMVISSVRHFAIAGDQGLNGFMIAVNPVVNIAVVKLIDGPGAKRAVYPYISHYSLQYVIQRNLTLGRPGLVGAAIAIFRTLGALIMAGLVAFYAGFAARRFGPASGWAVVAALSLSPMFASYVTSPYWAAWSFFLPFTAVLALYPRAGSPARFTGLACLAGLLVFFKALMGYEFLSCIAFSAALPVLFYEYEASGGLCPAVLRRVVVRGAIVGLCCAIGFALAVLMHVAKAAGEFGSWHKGWEALVYPFSYSTYDPLGTGIRTTRTGSIANILAMLGKTFILRNWEMQIPLYATLAVSTVMLRRRLGASWAALWTALPTSHRALALAFALAIPATLSWSVLAFHHALAHPHVAWVTGYVVTHLLAAMLAGANLGLLFADHAPQAAATR